MINYDQWLNKNYNKLEDEYDKYIEEFDCEIKKPLEFDEFIEEKFEDFISDYQCQKYDEMKDERI